MRKVCAAAIVAISTVAAPASHAATKDLTKAIFSAIPWDQDQPSPEQRLAFARAIEAYWEDFDSRVPRLSPSEQEWIETEMGAQGDRLERAWNSKEYAIWSLNRHVDLCLQHIRGVLGSFESEQAKQTEMFYWLKMVNCYDGSNDLTIYLDRAGISYNDDADRHIQTPISNLAQQIIVNKVAPMAMAEAMGWTFNN